MLDKRTIRLVSGASMIFSAPKIQWLHVFERLDLSANSNEDDLCETIVSRFKIFELSWIFVNFFFYYTTGGPYIETL